MWPFNRSAQKTQRAPNPHTKMTGRRSAGFYSTDVERLLSGWDSTSSSIDHYLQSELTSLRARSRKMVRANPYGKRFVTTIKSNVVGPSGVTVQSQSMRFDQKMKKEKLDQVANDAIEKAFKDWGKKENCDYIGKLSWLSMQNMAAACAAQDGEFLFRKRYGGKYGLQVQMLDPELLDTRKNGDIRNGGEIRLGVEYNAEGQIIGYWFRERLSGQYDAGKSYQVPAGEIIHGFISEWPDQSRGIPWMHASLEKNKHLEKFDEAAVINARSSAALNFGVLTSEPGEDPYTGDIEAGEGTTLDSFEPGTIKDIGDRKLMNVDSDYPHAMYSDFVRSQLQGIAAGVGISHHSLSGDLSGVNYSSIRAGVLEDREIFKGLQNWFIDALIRPVFQEWFEFAYAQDKIMIGSRPLGRPLEQYQHTNYQGRRWAWVDPQKDGVANKMSIDYNLKSRSQIMRDQGDDPETVFLEIQRENDVMDQFGIDRVAPPEGPEIVDPDSDEGKEND